MSSLFMSSELSGEWTASKMRWVMESSWVSKCRDVAADGNGDGVTVVREA
jgi:hypothetical protein